MNKTTRDIMALLNISEADAIAVQNQLDCDGFDYSECSRHSLKIAALVALDEINEQA